MYNVLTKLLGKLHCKEALYNAMDDPMMSNAKFIDCLSFANF